MLAFEKIKHKSAKLYLAGTFESEKTKNETIDLTRDNNVVYLGYLDRKEVVHYISKSQIGIVVLHPTKSYVDAYPTKLFEYMGMGIPVIASNFPLWNNIIRASNCGITIDPFDIVQLSNSIDFFLGNPNKALEMGLSGRKAIFKKYNWEIEEMKLIKKYNQII